MDQPGKDKEIQHRIFSDGAFQSLGPIGPDGLKRYTVGVCLLGRYEFTAHLGTEHITLIDASCFVNDQLVKQSETIVVPKGRPVVMQVQETCAYICRFER